MINIVQVVDNVAGRLNKNIGLFPIKEDTFRYYCFSELLEPKNGGKNNVNNIVLELPYDNKYKNYELVKNPANTVVGSPELDAFYYDGIEKIAIEFKYLKKDNNSNNNKKTIGKPNRLAQIYNDIFRLSIIDVANIEKYLIYVESKEMHDYKHAKYDAVYGYIFKRQPAPYTASLNTGTVINRVNNGTYYPETFNNTVKNNHIFNKSLKNSIKLKILYASNFINNDWIYLVQVL